VYVAAVPFNRFTVPAEQLTAADGWAQLTMTQLSGYPAARRQQLLVVFARASRATNALGGVSTRRLVSFPVDLRRQRHRVVGVAVAAPRRRWPPFTSANLEDRPTDLALHGSLRRGPRSTTSARRSADGANLR
jgi:hypothetical protein